MHLIASAHLDCQQVLKFVDQVKYVPIASWSRGMRMKLSSRSLSMHLPASPATAIMDVTISFARKKNRWSLLLGVEFYQAGYYCGRWSRISRIQKICLWDLSSGSGAPVLDAQQVFEVMPRWMLLFLFLRLINVLGALYLLSLHFQVIYLQSLDYRVT